MTDGPHRPVKVCFFNRSYWPDASATGQLLTELCEDLSRVHGMDVTVVTGRPTSPSRAAGDPLNCRLPGREHRNGVHVRRASGTTWSPTRFAGRAANYVTYFASATLIALRLPRQDVAVALTDPPIIGLAAIAARPRGGFVFFCQDIFPEVARLLTDFRSPLVDAVLDRVNRALVGRAARTIALGETMAHRLVEGKGASASRVVVIHNWTDTAAIVPSDKRNPFSEAHGLADRFVLLHAGNIGHGQNLDVVIEAAARLSNRPDIVILFIGDGTRREALQAAVESRRLSNVRFLPFQPRDQLRWTYASSDACLISLAPGLAGYIVPSKLYPVLAAGRPYIAAVDPVSEVAAITERHQCGLLVPPGDAAGLSARIVELADHAEARLRMGARARAASGDFDRARQVAAHAAVIREVAARAR
jgi:glycosyltransferase involved in cell wall biosynthesis